MAKNQQPKVVVEKSRKGKTPKQLALAERNNAEAVARLAKLQAHQKYINGLRHLHGIAGETDDFVLWEVGRRAVEAMELNLDAIRKTEARKRFFQDTYVQEAMSGPHRMLILSFLQGRISTFDRVQNFFKKRSNLTRPALRVA